MLELGRDQHVEPAASFPETSDERRWHGGLLVVFLPALQLAAIRPRQLSRPSICPRGTAERGREAACSIPHPITPKAPLALRGRLETLRPSALVLPPRCKQHLPIRHGGGGGGQDPPSPVGMLLIITQGQLPAAVALQHTPTQTHPAAASADSN